MHKKVVEQTAHSIDSNQSRPSYFFPFFFCFLQCRQLLSQNTGERVQNTMKKKKIQFRVVKKNRELRSLYFLQREKKKGTKLACVRNARTEKETKLIMETHFQMNITMHLFFFAISRLPTFLCVMLHFDVKININSVGHQAFSCPLTHIQREMIKL